MALDEAEARDRSPPGSVRQGSEKRIRRCRLISNARTYITGASPTGFAHVAETTHVRRCQAPCQPTSPGSVKLDHYQRSATAPETCRCPPIRERARCKLHGGLSTGPRTIEGMKRARAAVLKHGRYSGIAREAKVRVAAHSGTSGATHAFDRPRRGCRLPTIA